MISLKCDINLQRHLCFNYDLKNVRTYTPIIFLLKNNNAKQNFQHFKIINTPYEIFNSILIYLFILTSLTQINIKKSTFFSNRESF